MNLAAIDSPANWLGADIGKRSDWIYRLCEEEVGEIERALQSVRALGISVDEVKPENFPLRLFPRIAERALEFLEHGPGMFLIRGLPVERHTVEDLRLVYWALGQYLGTAVTQSRKGDVIGDVRDLNIFSDGRGRAYQSRVQLEFHTDSCDVVGLMVLRTAKSGGLSKIGSTVAVHNAMLRERPDLVPLLYQPFTAFSPSERQGACWTQPIFSLHEGHFSCKAGSLYIRLAQDRFPELPRLTTPQIEALELFHQISIRPGMHFSMMFQPGDLQLLNNHVTSHARTEFEDYAEPGRKRHLLRLWLSVRNSRPLSPLWASAWGDIRAGAVRGGYPADTEKRLYESLAE